ncbi:MAG: hypothetical protein JWN86_3855 [Planctomycetota bacterium]|nr:hypothetical protein [Planctomycetota bacterium]
MIAFALSLLLTAVGGSEGTPIRLHPENPRYFLFRGEPAFLITSGEHYGGVLNRDFDRTPYLDELKARGFNLTRVFSGTYREVPGSFNIKDNTLAPKRGGLASPWVQVQKDGEPEKFDLDRFDDAYFRRLKAFVSAASDRGIVVEYVLFCPLYEDNLWAVNPMNAANNINGVGKSPRTEVLTLKHADLVKRQLEFVRKAVTELNAFDNVYFEICNEPYFGGVTLEWQAKVAETIVEAEKSLSGRHMIAQNIANEKAKVENPNPAVSLFNFHYASPPAVIALNAGLKAAIGDDETGFRGTGDRHYRMEAWEFLLAGGSLYNNLDYSFTAAHPDGSAAVNDPTPGGGGPRFRRQLSILQRFLAGCDFVHMKPSPDFITKRVLPDKARVHALARPGEYAIYISGGPKATLTVRLPSGKYRYEWIDTRTGDKARTGGFDIAVQAGGEETLESPEYAEDIALKIVADGGTR